MQLETILKRGSLLTGMTWSLRIGTIAGIGIFVHWTFSILIIAVLFLFLVGLDADLITAIGGVFFILALFACVLLHELGHALCARRYNIGTRDITMLPIGGLARLERMPTEPKHEFWIAVAGPAVNVAIAGAVFVLIALVHGAEAIVPEEGLLIDLLDGLPLVNLMWMNVVLVVFNMIPAFPMDGGRVLRAALAARLPYHHATRIAATIGQGIAILFGLLGLLAFQPILLLIAIFVFLGAQAEAQYAETQFALKGLKVRDAMLTRFQRLSEDETLGDAVDQLLAGSQQDFPVVRGDDVVGLLTRHNLLQALSDHDRNAPVAKAMSREFQSVNEDDPLETLPEKLRMGESTTMPVMDNHRLTGLLTRENLAELIMIHSALSEGGNAPRVREILHRGREHTASDDLHGPFAGR